MTTATHTRPLGLRLPRLTARLKGSRSLWSFVCLVALVAVTVAYIVQMSSVTQRGYQMRVLEEDIATLQLENEQLQTHVAQSRSMENVNAQMQILGFVDADDIVYLSGTDSFAAR